MALISPLWLLFFLTSDVIIVRVLVMTCSKIVRGKRIKNDLNFPSATRVEPSTSWLSSAFSSREVQVIAQILQNWLRDRVSSLVTLLNRGMIRIINQLRSSLIETFTFLLLNQVTQFNHFKSKSKFNHKISSNCRCHRETFADCQPWKPYPCFDKIFAKYLGWFYFSPTFSLKSLSNDCVSFRFSLFLSQ